MSGKRHRLLLPAKGPEPEPEPEPSVPSEPEHRPDATKPNERRSAKHRLRSNACDRCRTRKCRCDGARPRCKPCAILQLKCIYTIDTKTETADEQEGRNVLLRVLRTAPEAEALELLRRLRASRSPQSAIASLQGSMDGKYQPSAIQTARSTSTPTASALEFELSVCHGLSYPRLVFVDVSNISLAPLKPSASAAFKSPLPLPPSQGPLNEDPEDYYCDCRLKLLDISGWTTVPIGNTTAAKAISTYLQSNHPVWGFFHADLFVRDLIDHGDKFCSPFLVNALMLYACQTYGAIDAEVPLLKGPFAETTKKLWSSNRPIDSILNLAAILMFSLSCHTVKCGVSLAELLEDARGMAERLQLFDVPDESMLRSPLSDLTEDERRATAHVAWGAYGWMSVNLSYTSIVTPISFPPLLPIPGSASDMETAGPKKPGTQDQASHLPSPYGRTFTSLCSFWVIMQGIGQVCHRGQDASNIPLAFVEQKFQQLLHWADSLGDQMTAEDHNPDSVIVFHMLLHCAILDLFLPFYDINDSHKLFSFCAQDTSPQAICRASINQLKNLLAVSRNSRHLVLTSNSYAAIVHLCHAMIRDGSSARSRPSGSNSPATSGATEGDGSESQDSEAFLDPDWHFYFLLCLASCQDMLLCFDVAAPLLRGLLTMALRDGAISAAEARTLVAKLESRFMMQPAEVLHADFGDVLLDLNRALTAPEEAQTRNLSQMFETLLAFEEFTKNDDFVASGV